MNNIIIITTDVSHLTLLVAPRTIPSPLKASLVTLMLMAVRFVVVDDDDVVVVLII